jgi:hypothetical protein
MNSARYRCCGDKGQEEKKYNPYTLTPGPSPLTACHCSCYPFCKKWGPIFKILGQLERLKHL